MTVALGAFFTAAVAYVTSKLVMHFLPHTSFLPLREIVVADSPWRKVLGHHPPGDTASDQVENGVDNSTLLVLRRPSKLGGSRNKRFNYSPLFVGKVAWIGVFFHRPPIVGSLFEKALTKCRI